MTGCRQESRREPRTRWSHRTASACEARWMNPWSDETMEPQLREESSSCASRHSAVLTRMDEHEFPVQPFILDLMLTHQ